MVSEKPPFDFTDEDDLEPDVVDDIICSMTNDSAVYLKKQQELIIEEDLITAGTLPFPRTAGEKKSTTNLGIKKLSQGNVP